MYINYCLCWYEDHYLKHENKTVGTRTARFKPNITGNACGEL